MGFLNRLRGLLRAERKDPEDTVLVYVQLPEPLQPIERGDRYEDPIDAELRLAKLGYVSGGGSSLSAPAPDGSRTIEWCGIDVDATDLPRTLELLRRELPPLGCLPRTQLQYNVDGAHLVDEFDGDRWDIGRPQDAK